MSNIHNTQVFEQIKDLCTKEHLQDFFGYDEIEACIALSDLGKLFDNNMDEAYSFLSFIKHS